MLNCVLVIIYSIYFHILVEWNNDGCRYQDMDTNSSIPPTHKLPEHTENSTIFFALSLVLFAAIGVVLFIRRCVRWGVKALSQVGS